MTLKGNKVISKYKLFISRTLRGYMQVIYIIMTLSIRLTSWQLILVFKTKINTQLWYAKSK